MKNLLIGLSALMAATGVHATTVVFDLASAPGNLTPTHTYTVSGFSLVATGYDQAGNKTDLFGKQGGGDEDGLGLANDPTGNNEIHFGSGFVQLDISQLIGKVNTHTFKFGTNSTTNKEKWAVFGSNTAGVHGSTPLLTGTVEETTQILHDMLGHRYYDFVEIGNPKGQGDNFLIENFSVGVPEPATWAMLLTGVFGIGAVARAARRPRAAR